MIKTQKDIQEKTVYSDFLEVNLYVKLQGHQE